MANMFSSILPTDYAEILACDITCGTVCLIVVLLVLLLIVKSNFRWYRVPGPWGLPFTGYYSYLSAKDTHIQLSQLAKRYGDVYGINVAGQRYIHLNSIKATKDAHVNKADHFPARSQDGIMNYLFGDGIIFLDGDHWRAIRKFFVHSMQQLGLISRKNVEEGPIIDAVSSLVAYLHKTNGEAVSLREGISSNCISTIRSLLFGHNVPPEDMESFEETYVKTLVPLTGRNILINGCFAMNFIFPRLPGYDDFVKGKEKLESILYKIIDRHATALDEDNPGDIVDYYLVKRITAQRKKDPQAHYFTDQALVSSLIQIYGDGTFGVAEFIASILYTISGRRDIQDKIYEEILKEIGLEKVPSWDDKAELPFTMATIRECFRFTVLFPLMPGRECCKDTDILGIPVSKGDVTLVNFWAAHQNPDSFKDPHRFDPERFLVKDPLETERTDQPMLFGLGRRSCAGEGLVMTYLFAIFTGLLQHFYIVPENEDEVKSEEPLIYDFGAGSKIRAIPRSSDDKL